MAEGSAAVERRGGNKLHLRQFGQRRESLTHLALGVAEVAAQGDECGVHRVQLITAEDAEEKQSISSKTSASCASPAVNSPVHPESAPVPVCPRSSACAGCARASSARRRGSAWRCVLPSPRPESGSTSWPVPSAPRRSRRAAA